MSSSAFIKFEDGTVGVPAEEWQAFCAEHHVRHSPQTVGGNVYYAGEVEVHYEQHWLVFSTYFFGRAMAEVARLAMIAWHRWGGNLSASPEIRDAVYKEHRP